jgi:hypothetical protein
MSLILDSEVFTAEMTNDSITIIESMGVRQISVFNATAVNGTVIGTKKLGALASSNINIEQDDSFTVKAIDGSVVKNLTITAPAGCTLKIVAQ